MPGDMLTAREVADYLGIHEKQVCRLLRQGRLPGTRVTDRWIFSRRLVMEWIEACSREAMKPKSSQTESTVEPHHLVISGSDDLVFCRLCYYSAAVEEVGVRKVRRRLKRKERPR